MQVSKIARAALAAVCLALVSCGGGGGGGQGGNPPPPVRTVFVATQPSGAAPSAAFAVQPVVHLRRNGATNTADNTTVVTVAIVTGTGTAGAQLTGTTTATAVAGVATFTNLGINTAGTNYQLRFTAAGHTEASSSAFRITAPPVRTLVVATQPAGAVPAAAFTTQPVVQVRSNGALDATDNTHRRHARRWWPAAARPAPRCRVTPPRPRSVAWRRSPISRSAPRAPTINCDSRPRVSPKPPAARSRWSGRAR